MSTHAKATSDRELDERFEKLFEQCCEGPTHSHPPAAPLTPGDIRAAVRRRALARLEDRADPTLRRPTRPCKPITPPARRARLIAPPPASATLDRGCRTVRDQTTSRAPPSPKKPSGQAATTASHHSTTAAGPPAVPTAAATPRTPPAIDAAAISVNPPASTSGATTRVALPGGEILEVSTRIIQTTRRYRARTNNGHWVLRWDRNGGLTMARFVARGDHP